MGLSQEQVIVIYEDLKAKKKAHTTSIDELRERIERIRAQLESVETALLGLAETYKLPLEEKPPPAIKPTQFRTKTISQAAAEYLSLVGEPARTAAIWDALVRGGMQSNSRNPINNLGTTLSAKPEVFERTDNGWVLVPKVAEELAAKK